MSLGSAGRHARFAAAMASSSSSPGATLIVFDASGSMSSRIKGETKMAIARRVVRELVTALPANTRLGLVAYGHRKANDCQDIELLIAPDVLDGSEQQRRLPHDCREGIARRHLWAHRIHARRFTREDDFTERPRSV